MADGTPPPGRIDWSQYFNLNNLQTELHKLDPKLLQIARGVAPKGIQDLLNRFGWQEIPQEVLPIGEGELVVSPDKSVVGFQPEGVEAGLCGIAVSPGEESSIRSSRARVFRAESDLHYKVNIPEGPYQLVLVAPQPRTDSETQEIISYTALAMVASSEDQKAGTVTGTLTAFGGDKNPIRWMVLNEWSQPGVLRCAYRHIPGIVFPEKPGETEAPVLKLYSLQGERAEDMPDDVVAGSGLVAVKFFEHRIDVSGRRSKGSGKPFPNIWDFISPRQPALAEITYRMPTKDYTDGGLTVFEYGTTTAYGVEKGGISKPVGPTVLLSVTTSPESQVAPVALDGVTLHEHRNPTDPYPTVQALARWGFGSAKELIPIK